MILELDSKPRISYTANLFWNGRWAELALSAEPMKSDDTVEIRFFDVIGKGVLGELSPAMVSSDFRLLISRFKNDKLTACKGSRYHISQISTSMRDDLPRTIQEIVVVCKNKVYPLRLQTLDLQ